MLLFHHFSNSHSSFALNTSCIHPPTLCFTLGRFWPLQALIYRKLLYPYHCTKNIPPVALLTWNLTALFLGINFIRHFSMKEEWFFKSLLHSNIVDFFIGFSKVLRSLCKLCPSLQRNTHMLVYQFQIIYDILILHSPLWPSLHKTENISRFRQIKRPPQEEETRTSLTLRLFYRVTVKEISNIFWLLLPFVLLNKCRWRRRFRSWFLGFLISTNTTDCPYFGLHDVWEDQRHPESKVTFFSRDKVWNTLDFFLCN